MSDTQLLLCRLHPYLKTFLNIYIRGTLDFSEPGLFGFFNFLFNLQNMIRTEILGAGAVHFTETTQLITKGQTTYGQATNGQNRKKMFYVLFQG